MSLLFFRQHDHEAEPIKNQEDKLIKLLSLLQAYNLTTHDNETRRSKNLQAIVDHLETMTLTPSLRRWVENDLIEHLRYYGITSTNDFTNPGPS